MTQLISKKKNIVKTELQPPLMGNNSEYIPGIEFQSNIVPGSLFNH